jgi:hypothetical protein
MNDNVEVEEFWLPQFAEKVTFEQRAFNIFMGI